MTSPRELSDALAAYDEQVEAAGGGCTDGYCVVKQPFGMHTNGGCRCWQDKFKAQRMMLAGRKLRQAIGALDPEALRASERAAGREEAAKAPALIWPLT